MNKQSSHLLVQRDKYFALYEFAMLAQTVAMLYFSICEGGLGGQGGDDLHRC